MAKIATTIEQQIDLLQSRGLVISDKNKAKEILQDIGYYRLGFYLFPFEKSYPRISNRTHQYIEGATFESAVGLYYFDCDLRLLLMRYLNRIEIAFRTSIIYNLSNKYASNPVWFVSPSVVNRSYTASFADKVYNSDFRRNPFIRRHHRNNPNDRFAPAWKTLEFMTFGAVMKLYEELKDQCDKILIAHKFGIRQVVTFESYMHTVRQVRNACAHGQLLFDLKLSQAIRRGPAGSTSDERTNIIGALRVVKYIMGTISENRASEMGQTIKSLYNRLCSASPIFKALIPDFSTI